MSDRLVIVPGAFDGYGTCCRCDEPDNKLNSAGFCGDCWSRLTPNQIEKFRDVEIEKVVERRTETQHHHHTKEVEKVDEHHHHHETVVPNVSRWTAWLLGVAGGAVAFVLLSALRAALKL